MIQEKSWGTAQTLYVDDCLQIDRIHAKAGRMCSRHFHRHKTNCFVVLSGVLEVTEYEPGSGSRITVTLNEHSPVYAVRENHEHRFVAVTDVVAIEVYVAISGEVSRDDIYRIAETVI